MRLNFPRLLTQVSRKSHSIGVHYSAVFAIYRSPSAEKIKLPALAACEKKICVLFEQRLKA